MFKKLAIVAMMLTASSLFDSVSAGKPGACVDTLATCAAGKCMAKGDCFKQPGNYTWDDAKCDGDKCGCCEEKKPVEPQPTCFKKDDECSSLSGACQTSDDLCMSLPGYTFDSTICTSEPVVNGTACGCCYRTEKKPACLKKDDACKSMGAGAKCVKDMFECNRGRSGFVFDSTKCKSGSNDTTCGCCYKPKQCKMSGECGKKKGKCMSPAQCNSVTHSFDNSCGTDLACGCCFPKP